jgi:4-amino-4-deoxy-L-arabinose transferase-like glycosyltransferase
MPLQYKKPWLITITLTVLLAFAFQGSRGLWEPDEGRYVRCAYEMLKSGDWLTPTIDNKPHFTKPPLTYWLIASGLSLFGNNEWGARFFYALAFIGTALMTGLLGTCMWGQVAGLLSCLVFSTMVFPFTAANITTTDMLLTFFETASMLFFWLSYSARHDEQPKINLYACLMFFSFGLSFLTKGPPGLIPLVIIVVYLFLNRTRKWISIPIAFFGVLIFAALAFPWYVLVIKKHYGLLSYFIQDEIIGRIFLGVHTRNPGLFGSFKVYPHTLLLGSLPWAYFWFTIAWKTRPQIFTAAWWHLLRARKNALFLTLWFCISLFLLSAANSRLPMYVLPLFVPLALATARSLLRYYPAQAVAACFFRSRQGALVMILAVFLIASRAIAAHVPTKIDSRVIAQVVQKIVHERIADVPYEIVLVDLHHDGLAFYTNSTVENVSADKDRDISFSAINKIEQKCDEILSSRVSSVFLLNAKSMKKVLPELDKRRIPYVVEKGPFDYKIIICAAAVAGNPEVKGNAAVLPKFVDTAIKPLEHSP